MSDDQKERDNDPIIRVPQGYPRVVALAERLGVKPAAGPTEGAIVVACGPNATGPHFDVVDLIHATLDRLEAAGA